VDWCLGWQPRRSRCRRWRRLYTASTQITAEDQRSQTEFLRSKQQDAYAQFITAEADEVRLRSAYVTAYVSTLRSEDKQSAIAAAAAAKNELSQSHDKLTQALGNVVLVGSSDAACRRAKYRRRTGPLCSRRSR
jgi:hypothetical protein